MSSANPAQRVPHDILTSESLPYQELKLAKQALIDKEF
jgi:hypothetical protein